MSRRKPTALVLALVLGLLCAVPAPAAGPVAPLGGAVEQDGADTSVADQGAPDGTDSSPSDGSGEEAGDGGAANALGDLPEAIGQGAKNLFEDPAGTLRRWALDYGPLVAGRVALFLLLLFVARILARAIGRITRGALDRAAPNASELLKEFVQSTVSKVVFFLGLVLALQNLGLDIAPLLAGIGVLGFVVGFALQDTLGNFAAGIMLLLYRPYDVGDYVEVAGKEGTVRAMTLVATTLSTLDNQSLTVPNGKIWGGVIRNVTANPTRRIVENVGIGYGDDVDRAMDLALEVVRGLDAVASDPEPQVVLIGLGDSSVDLSMRAWVPTGDYFATVCELRRRIKLRFDAEGISIPYPQRDVHVHRVGAELDV
ncbi:MAG: mechanosensitive ion channel family protein [Planctomycetota bacterium]